ncbi:MAG: hypothetical protein ACK2U1_26070 [Anaerolineales bacterium]|jgi:hypothetical protein
MITRIENEIHELHQFFQDWYNNQLSPTDENFARCANVLHSNFTIIFPIGDRMRRETLLEILRNAHGSHTNIRIWIEHIQILYQFGDLVLATYEEWQEIDSQINSRLSTVLFQQAPTTPNGLRWLHVHETWMNT